MNPKGCSSALGLWRDHGRCPACALGVKVRRCSHASACMTASKDKKLAGAARNSFVNKCEADAKEKKVTGAGKNSKVKKCVMEAGRPPDAVHACRCRSLSGRAVQPASADDGRKRPHSAAVKCSPVGRSGPPKVTEQHHRCATEEGEAGR
jgi:hypothetical protein